MQADNKTAAVAIEITHKDAGVQQLYFEQFAELKKIMENVLEEQWTWQLHITSENGKLISRIFKQMESVSIFKKEEWPLLISFFKPRIIALDEFWSSAKYGFEVLR